MNWYDYGFRNYDPQIGRFTQLDPLTWEYPELTNYQYASNEPIANVDRDGLEADPCVVGPQDAFISNLESQGMIDINTYLLDNGNIGVGWTVPTDPCAVTPYGYQTVPEVGVASFKGNLTGGISTPSDYVNTRDMEFKTLDFLSLPLQNLDNYLRLWNPKIIPEGDDSKSKQPAGYFETGNGTNMYDQSKTNGAKYIYGTMDVSWVADLGQLYEGVSLEHYITSPMVKTISITKDVISGGSDVKGNGEDAKKAIAPAVNAVVQQVINKVQGNITLKKYQNNAQQTGKWVPVTKEITTVTPHGDTLHATLSGSIYVPGN